MLPLFSQSFEMDLFAPICRWFTNCTFDTIMWTFDHRVGELQMETSSKWHSSKIERERALFCSILQIMLPLLLDVGYVVPRDVSATYMVFLLLLSL
jgi:hypothetical protein